MRKLKWSACRIPVLPLLILLSLPPPADADDFLLPTGGRIRGRCEFMNDQDRSYRVVTEQGIRVLLRKADVEQRIEPSPALIRYEQIAPDFKDTVQQQWLLAEWCREQRLPVQRNVHLNRIIELDPDHLLARRALGFVFLDGGWITREQFRKQNGYRLVGGRWVLPQELQLADEQEQLERSQLDWYARLKRYRATLRGDDARTAAAAAEAIRSINDPHAVRALAKCLVNEPQPETRLCYVDALGRIADDQSRRILVEHSLVDPHVEVFHTCLDHLVRQKRPEITSAYVQVLRDENNGRVNRAAMALKRLEDKTAVSALIDALVTTHKFRLPGEGRNPDSVSTTFAAVNPSAANSITSGPGAPAAASPLGAGFMTGARSEFVYRRVPNQEVLSALVHLSGGNSFGFDVRAWKYWQAVESTQAAPATTFREQ
jgi:HEAT repeats